MVALPYAWPWHIYGTLHSRLAIGPHGGIRMRSGFHSIGLLLSNSGRRLNPSSFFLRLEGTGVSVKSHRVGKISRWAVRLLITFGFHFPVQRQKEKARLPPSHAVHLDPRMFAL